MNDASVQFRWSSISNVSPSRRQVTASPCYRLMRKLTQIAHRLLRIDQLREPAFDYAAVHLLDAHAAAGNAGDRMQHDEANAARLEVRVGCRFTTVFKSTIRVSIDARDVAE